MYIRTYKYKYIYVYIYIYTYITYIKYTYTYTHIYIWHDGLPQWRLQTKSQTDLDSLTFSMNDGP